MTYNIDRARKQLAALSGSSRRMLDYVAALEGGARYATLRHLSRVSEEDMIEDVREAVQSGLLVRDADEPNTYDFSDEGVRLLVLAEAGEERLQKLRARAKAARGRVEGTREA